ncbi:carboxypeptidase regulatory-like domain-containing protein, partial [Streptomyces sp. UH6]|uniref:carboxypeptidase regulatory-like domain-containing protein n=1 Tax=Streptomyces sp. UH6 TaxID=2748379 RepID=UPI0015D475DB
PAPDTKAEAAAAPEDKIAKSLKARLAKGPADFYVVMKEKADLSGLARIEDHAKRTGRGRADLVRVAERSQRELVGLLAEEKVAHDSHWIINTVRVEQGDERLAAKIAALPSVEEVRQVADIRLTGAEGVEEAGQAGAEEDETAWGVADIGAPQAWADSGTRGEGVVVANIDTGVRLDHEALAGNYRGNRGDGTFSHDYNWFDPAGICGATSGPCDNQGHGTHTMGTMAGGGPHRIGVAPGATWIAAKGCEGGSCTSESLLSSGEWIIAPTDVNGQNPRPEMAPNIVNNSWGTSVHDPFYEEIVQRWTEVGIFAVFSAGNEGPDCSTMGSPADYASTFSVAAYAADHAITDFSSRGSDTSAVRPDIAAPGDEILSAAKGGGYVTNRGTSMAAPHVAGTVALLWSHAPQMFGDIESTWRVLQESATDVDDTSCGGDAGTDGVWGAGRLNVPAALAAVPDEPLGTLELTVTQADDGSRVVGAPVTVTGDSGRRRYTTTGTDGVARLVLQAGSYQVTTSAFGLHEASRNFTVTADAATRMTLPLAVMSRHTLAGRVVDTAGVPVVGAQVRLTDVPLSPVESDGQGRFRFEKIPAGSYRIGGTAAGCTMPLNTRITMRDADTSVDVAAPPRTDQFGQACYGAAPDPVAGTSAIALTGDDEAGRIDLPFAFRFYGETYSQAYVGTNGFLSFTAAATMPINVPLPHGGKPNAAVLPFWDDLVIDASASIRTGVEGSAPDRRFAVEWRDALIYGTQERITVQAVLHESGAVGFEYVDLGESDVARGASATAGMEDATGEDAVPLNANKPWLRSGTAFRVHLPGRIHGRVTDHDSGAPVEDVMVLSSHEGGQTTLYASSGPDGAYSLPVPYGDHQVVAWAEEYAYVIEEMTLDAAGPEREVDFDLDRNVVSGTVTDHQGNPVVAARISSPQGPHLEAVTGADGTYRMTMVPVGELTLTVDAWGCSRRTSRTITVDGDERADFTLAERVEGGWSCDATTGPPLPVDTRVDLTGDEGGTTVGLPFAFPFRGTSAEEVTISVNGVLSFDGSAAGWNRTELPNPNQPDGGIYPFWDDLLLDEGSSVWTGVVGEGSSRRFVVEWRDAQFFAGDGPVTFQAALGADGTVTFHYRDLADTVGAQGAYAVIGVENPDGATAFNWSVSGSQPLSENLTVTFTSTG